MALALRVQALALALALTVESLLTSLTNVALARDAFLAALNDPDLEEKIHSREPENLDEACRIALQQEIIHNTVQAGATGYKGHHARQVIEDPTSEPEEVTGSNDYKRKWDWKARKPKQQTEVRVAKAVEAVDSNPPGKNELVKDLLKQVTEEQRRRL